MVKKFLNFLFLSLLTFLIVGDLSFSIAANNPSEAFHRARFVEGSLISSADILAGQTLNAFQVTVENTGSDAWLKDKVFLSYIILDYSKRIIAEDQLRFPLPQEVAPNSRIIIEAAVVAPEAEGEYTILWDLVAEGQYWFKQHGTQPAEVKLRVVKEIPPDFYRVEFISHDTPQQMICGETKNILVTLKNNGTGTWLQRGTVMLSYHWEKSSSKDQTLSTDGLRTMLSADVDPGGVIPINATVRAPEETGSYNLIWDLVHEGITWFSEKGTTNTLKIPDLKVISSAEPQSK